MKKNITKTVLLFFVFSLFILVIPQKVKSEKLIHKTELISLINQSRKKIGLPNVIENKKLQNTAQARLVDMQKQGYFSHLNPKGENIKKFLQDSNYNIILAGENLAKNFTNEKELDQAWLKSFSHRRIMMGPIYKDIGIASGWVKINQKNHYITVMVLGLEK